MTTKWMALFLIAALGFNCASANECDFQEPNTCYTDLVNYEQEFFPLYGGPDGVLEETCEHINASYECVEAYSSTCQGHPDCDDECKALLGDIHMFLGNPGLKLLSGELCKTKGVLKQTYLENYSCLERNEEKYYKCINISKTSQSYLASMRSPDVILARCCYVDWYAHCFINATSQSCSENATFFVSYALHTILGQVVFDMCEPTNVTCSTPPMPPEIPEKTDKPDVIEPIDDNTIDNHSSERLPFCVVHLLILTYCIFTFSKKLL